MVPGIRPGSDFLVPVAHAGSRTAFAFLTGSFAWIPDCLTASSPTRPLACGLFSRLLVARDANARAQHPDSDGDGLFDDDETDVYGADPFNLNTDAEADGDADGDGAEVYHGANPLINDVTIVGDGNINAADPGPAGTIDVGETGDIITGDGNLGIPTDPFPASNTILTCRIPGVPRDNDGQCCTASLCCFDGVSPRLECLDITTRGGVRPRALGRAVKAGPIDQPKRTFVDRDPFNSPAKSFVACRAERHRRLEGEGLPTVKTPTPTVTRRGVNRSRPSRRPVPAPDAPGAAVTPREPTAKPP